MTGRGLILAVGLALALPSLAVDQPYLVENRVQNSLDTSLSRVIVPGKYIVQVDAEVSTHTERRMVEGETVVTGPEEQEEPEEASATREIMPGFLPEYTPPKKKPERTSQNRQVYRMVESPVLNLLRVHVTFDEQLPPETITKARYLVTSFLTSAYPNKHVVNFSLVPMLKTREEIALEKEKERERIALEKEEKAKREQEERDRKLAALNAPKEKEKEEVNPWKEYLPWAATGVLALLLLVVLLMQNRQAAAQRSAVAENHPPSQNPWAAVPPFHQYASQGPYDARGHFARPERNWQADEENTKLSRAPQGPPPDSIDFANRRRRFLDTIFRQSDTFRLYHTSLGPDLRDEVYAILRGPAYEKFLEGMGLKKPSEDPNDPQDAEERLAFHEKQFDEFTRAKDWQDRQFFGFLQRLNEEQIMTLVHHEDPFAVCVMLRFMKPNQSALVLDALPPGRRVEVLKHVHDVQKTAFHDLAMLEQNIRTSVERLPDHFFGSKKEDVTYWTRVLDEAQDQDGILHDLESTQPEIFPELAKHRFKLDEAMNVDPKVLKKVLSEADNEELALALISCPQKLQAFILERMSPRRRAMLEEQLATARNAGKEQIVEARLKLTKRFREALA